MTLDYNSLLLATGFSAGCLGVTLFGSWMAARTERFLLTWSCGALCIVATVFAYSAYGEIPNTLLLAATFIFLTGGFSFVYGAAVQFRTGRLPVSKMIAGFVVPLLIAAPTLFLRWNAVSLIVMNLAATVLLLLTAWEYVRTRAEAPAPILALAALYSITGISFFLCGAVLIANGDRIIPGAPTNWAENLNLAICIAGLSGIGALSFGLNQWRLARRHEKDATTDSLTGLLNRRALFDRFGKQNFNPKTAVILFDLDGFKAVNDRHGHAVGDTVLKIFAEELSSNCRSSDAAARLGGEEFAVVLEPVMPGGAERVAERIRARFAKREIALERGTLRCTVSAGIAFGTDEGRGLDAMLSIADKALYSAKNDGRNRVVVSTYLRAV